MIVPIGNLGKSNAGMDLLGSLGLEGGTGLAARLAARRRQQGSENDGVAVTPSADGTSRPRQRFESSGGQRSNGDRRASTPRGERRRDDNARAQGRGGAGQPQRGDYNNRASRPQRSERQGGYKRATAKSSEIEKDGEASEKVKAPRPRVQVHVQDDGGKIAVTTSELDKLFAGTLSSDPTAITLAAVKPRARNLQNENVARRTQHILEKRGGDYSLYLPADLGTTFPEQLGPLGSARLVMCHRPDVGLKSRERLLGAVQSMVVNKVVESLPATDA